MFLVRGSRLLTESSILLSFETDFTGSRWRRYGTPPASGRPLEIILGANDFDGDTAERYGYVNRALPDAELDGFVDTLARRIASFDRRAIAAAKNLINQVSLPSADRLLDALNSFQTALTWGETQKRIQALLERGLQRDRAVHWLSGRTPPSCSQARRR